MTNNYEKYKY